MGTVDKDTSICIVGGGPAGLSLAMYLEKNGYENYRIFERADHVVARHSRRS